MSIESELKKLQNMISEVLTKLDQLIEEKDTLSMMILSEKSVEFLNEEPDLYSLDDLKVRY